MNDKRLPYISLSLLAVTVLVLAAITFGISREIKHTQNHIEKLESLKEKAVSEADVQLDKIDEPKVDSEVAYQTTSAEEVGEEVVKLQDILGDLFCTDGNLPKELVDIRLEEGPKLGKRLSELTDIDEDMYYYAAWKLHEDWTLELASVIGYEAVDEFPVLFTMKTEEGELAGLVKAAYDTRDQKLYHVEQHYVDVDYRNLLQELGDP